jgi:hypothetical protein
MPTQEEVYDMSDGEYQVLDQTPATQELPADEKPAGRPKGVHAAINKGKAKPKQDKPTEVESEEQNEAGDPENEAEELDADALRDDKIERDRLAAEDGATSDDDVFGAPGDEEYDPA